MFARHAPPIVAQQPVSADEHPDIIESGTVTREAAAPILPPKAFAFPHRALLEAPLDEGCNCANIPPHFVGEPFFFSSRYQPKETDQGRFITL
jgi:hypothetical protein